ncbi:MAG: acylphosphatase [Rubrobacteraceae bacterium]
MSENTKDHKRAHVFIAGRVQGIFFRDSTRQQANRLGLTGWATNLPDGRVEAVFEGPENAVREAVDWCAHGPEQAHVEDVSTEYEPPENLSGFEIR